jgi:hypothetical protein
MLKLQIAVEKEKRKKKKRVLLTTLVVSEYYTEATETELPSQAKITVQLYRVNAYDVALGALLLCASTAKEWF